MKKKLLWTIPLLLSVSTAIVTPILLNTTKNTNDFQTVARTGSVNDNQEFSIFKNHSLKIEDGIATFNANGIKSQDGNLELVSLSNAESFNNIDYNLIFDSKQNIFTLNISYLDDSGTKISEKIIGTSIIRDNGELDVRFLTQDNEVKYASELKELANYQNVGFFSWLRGKIKKAAQTLYNVVIKPLIKVVATVADFVWDTIKQVYYVPANAFNYINSSIAWWKSGWEFQYGESKNTPEPYVAYVGGSYAKLTPGKSIKIGIDPYMSTRKKEAAKKAIYYLNSKKTNDGSYLIPNSLSHYETTKMSSIFSWGVTDIGNIPDYSITDLQRAPGAIQLGLNIGTNNNFDGIALSGVNYNGNIDKSHILINTNSDKDEYLFHLMVHELGHLLGLRDVKNIWDDSIMSYKDDYEENLTPKDTRNLNWLYNGKFQN